jgi:hypothetical protein
MIDKSVYSRVFSHAKRFQKIIGCSALFEIMISPDCSAAGKYDLMYLYVRRPSTIFKPNLDM